MAPWLNSKLCHICGAGFHSTWASEDGMIHVCWWLIAGLSTCHPCRCVLEKARCHRECLGAVTQTRLSWISPHRGVCCLSELVRELFAAPVLKDPVYLPPPFISFSINLFQGRCVHLWKTRRSFQSLVIFLPRSSDKIPNAGSAERRIWKIKWQLEICNLRVEQISWPWLCLCGIPLTHYLRKRAFVFMSKPWTLATFQTPCWIGLFGGAGHFNTHFSKYNTFDTC